MLGTEIESLIKTNIEDAIVELTTDDNVHFSALVITDKFKDKPLIARQRMVYQTLAEHIKDGSLHALSLKTYTISEWQAKNKQEES